MAFKIFRIARMCLRNNFALISILFGHPYCLIIDLRKKISDTDLETLARGAGRDI